MRATKHPICPFTKEPMLITVLDLQNRLTKEYGMKCEVFPLDPTVTFFGSELECYRMSYRFKKKENRVAYSKPLECWYISFSRWFTIEFSQNIIA
ncbi:hypothetical protein [Croceimicrobium hydrocarbonivorans]|uniref:Uncharacterized protein n=1 Tax=Croceimicrobium hydrocarbonivorans TaxID=2761580 RepID=A0A7H0VBC0_9FLAO|nr:hypothetical protein [Croceimicrobium hydrocarbonivorans]QNR23018.1 hypothetical protein H4K34_11570 [Croceimicrobium hydrocarbonivorans]